MESWEVGSTHQRFLNRLPCACVYLLLFSTSYTYYAPDYELEYFDLWVYGAFCNWVLLCKGKTCL